MSTLKAEVIQIGRVEKHPNADSLSITKVYDFPVVFRTEDFREGDKAIYIPIDSMVNTDRPEFSFLKSDKRNAERIRAKKLRGVFSMGMLVKCNAVVSPGEDMTEALGITKYEEPAPTMAEEQESDPGFIPRYTDIESFRRYPDIIKEGESVVVTEKLHGANGRWVYHDGRFWAGSHNTFKKPETGGMWWNAIEPYKDVLKTNPGLIFFGEVFGRVQDLHYGMSNSYKAAFFDIFDMGRGKYVCFDEFMDICERHDLPVVPVCYMGPWSKDVLKDAELDSALAPGQMREGFVIKPTMERYDYQVGRVILKYHSERYLTRKGGTERH